MRSRMLAASASVAGIEMEAPIDGGTVAGEEALSLLDVAAPALEAAGGEELLERRTRAGGAEDDPGAGARGAANLLPQRRQRRAIHPVDAVEQDIAVTALVRFAGEPMGHRNRMGGDARQAVPDGLVIVLLQIGRQRRARIGAIAAAESLPCEIILREREVASEMPHAIMIEPGEIAARCLDQAGELTGRNSEAVENEGMARQQTNERRAEQRLDFRVENRALLGEASRRQVARRMLAEQAGETLKGANELSRARLVVKY